MTVEHLWGHVWRLAAGIVVLAVVFWWCLPLLAFPLLPVMFLVGGPGPLNLVWLGMIIAMIGFGLKRGQPGYVLSPLVYCAVWYAISFNMRSHMQEVERSGDFVQAVPAGTSEIRTFIIDGPNKGISRNPIANGAVDRIVKVSRDNNNTIEEIIETTLGRGDQCSQEQHNGSYEFLSVGRLEECFRTRRLDSVPDGLLIQYRYLVNIAHGATGCCNELRVTHRKQGTEEPLFAWRQGYATMLSYLPSYGAPGMYLIQQPGIWDSGSGPWHVVHYGAQNLDYSTIVTAIYGAQSDAPLSTLALSPVDLMERAASLAGGNGSEKQYVVPLLKQAKSAGLVDDRWLRIVATLIGRDTTLDAAGKLTVLLSDLTPEQKSTFGDHVLDRLNTPRICGNCFGSEFSWRILGDVPNSDGFVSRARRIFEQGNDLQTWQYEAALRMSMFDGRSPVTKYNAELEKVMFNVVVSDRSSSLGARAVAFKRVFRGQNAPERESERTAIIDRLDDVADAQLDQFINAFWPGGDLLETSVAMAGQIAALCDRFTRISDPVITNMLRTHSRVHCP